MLGQGLLGMLGQVSWEASGRSLGGVLGVLGVSWRGPGRGPGEALEASWKPLGAPKATWSAKWGLPGAYGAVLEAS